MGVSMSRSNIHQLHHFSVTRIPEYYKNHKSLSANSTSKNSNKFIAIQQSTPSVIIQKKQKQPPIQSQKTSEMNTNQISKPKRAIIKKQLTIISEDSCEYRQSQFNPSLQKKISKNSQQFINNSHKKGSVQINSAHKQQDFKFLSQPIQKVSKNDNNQQKPVIQQIVISSFNQPLENRISKLTQEYSINNSIKNKNKQSQKYEDIEYNIYESKVTIYGCESHSQLEEDDSFNNILSLDSLPSQFKTISYRRHHQINKNINQAQQLIAKSENNFMKSIKVLNTQNKISQNYNSSNIYKSQNKINKLLYF